ncbi:hypothetical protein BDD12DRAFT_535362 [Trichophaea hybrida]|nr:hypothetical protein BDD12DRAFT_535362 [Trichophaea hybrida]
MKTSSFSVVLSLALGVWADYADYGYEQSSYKKPSPVPVYEKPKPVYTPVYTPEYTSPANYTPPEVYPTYTPPRSILLRLTPLPNTQPPM